MEIKKKKDKSHVIVCGFAVKSRPDTNPIPKTEIIKEENYMLGFVKILDTSYFLPIQHFLSQSSLEEIRLTTDKEKGMRFQ